jgi:apolipoprotein N-acyltransferase
MKKLMARILPPRPLIVPAAVSGLLVTMSFPTASVGPLVFVALVPLLASVMRHRPQRGDAFRTGFLFGFVCYLSMLWWVAALIPSADVTIPGLMTPALLLLVLYLSLYPGLFLFLASKLTRFRMAGFLVAAPALWVLLEALRSRGELAFPWGSLGYALSSNPPLAQAAAVGGLPLLSLLVVGVNVLLAAAVSSRSLRPRLLLGGVSLAILAAMWVSGASEIERFDDSAAERVRTAVVQPNVDLAIKWKPEYRDSTLRLIERLVRESVAEGAGLIVFPETSAPVYMKAQRHDSRRYRERLGFLSAELETPIFIGFLDYRPDGPGGDANIYNASGVFRVDGVLDTYEKNHLLPFGEALPGSRRWRWLRKIDFGQANFQQGTARGPVNTGPVAITPLICFESVFPYLCARGVAGGTELLVNITNDGWFGDTPGPFQHAQMAILRAVEFRRYLVRSANTGVSMVVSPTGEIVSRIGLFEEGVLVEDVAVLSGQTFYARHGDLPWLVGCLLLVGLGMVTGRFPRSSDAGIQAMM